MAVLIRNLDGLNFGGAVVTTSSGSIYVFQVGNTSATIRVYKSTDGGSSFSNISSITNTTWAGGSCGAGSISVAIDSIGYIHVVAVASASNTETRDVAYARLNTSDDTWDSWEAAATYTKHPVSTGVSIAIDSSNKPHILYLNSVANMGNDYIRVYYTNKVGASWLTPEVVSTETTTSYSYPCILVGLNDIVQAQYARITSGISLYRTRSGTWGAETSITGSYTSSSKSLTSLSNGSMYRYNYQASPLYQLAENTTAITGIYVLPVVINAVLKNAYRYVVYIDYTDHDVKYIVNTGAEWSTPVVLESGNFSGCFAEYAFNYEYQSGRINYLFDDGSNLYYNYFVTAPTVALNTPTEGQDLTDTTPDLVFTGTDPESQPIEYQVQVDTSGSFTYLPEQPASTVGQVIGGGTAGSGESAQANGQTFVATRNALLTSIDLLLYKAGSPTDYVVVTIHSGSETGTTLGTSGQLSAAGLTTSDVGEIRNFAFTPSITLTQGTTYYIVIERSGARSITDAAVIRTTTSNVYSSGTWRRRDNNTWSDQTGDIYFKLYSTYPIDAFSSSGIGFSGTHPFTSGSSVTYTAGKRDFNLYQAGDNLSYGLDNQVRYRGQSFHGMDGKIVSTGAWLKKDASGGSTSVKMSLWSHSGTFGSTGMPSSRLATSTTSIPVGDLSSSLTYYEFYFTGSDAITLTSGSNYCAVVELVNYGGSDAITIAMATSASRHAGNAASSTSGTGWTSYQNYDLDFTVLVGLPESTTYYWRVRGNDGAEWGDWTSPRSFDLTSGSGGGVSVTPTAVSTVTDRINPTVRYGSTSVTPAVLSAVSATVNPTVQLGSVSKTPPVVDSAASIGTLTVVHGSLVIPISALATASSVIAPSVVLGSLSLSNLLSSSTASVINPTVTIGTGNVTAEPSAVSAAASQVNPTVQLGSVDVVPANQPQTVAVSINPQYSAGSLSLQPTPLEAIAAALYSDVVAGSLLLAPAAVISATATVIEAVSYGAISVVPASLQAGTAVYLEAIHLGSLSLSDLLSSVPVETVNPTINITSGNISITPEAVSSVAVSLSPQSIYGSCLVTLQPVLAATESLCQAVQYGALSIVPTSTYLVAGSMLGAVSLGSVLVAVAPLDTKAETTQALVIQSSLVLPLPVASAASQSLATATNGSLSIQPSPLDLVSTSVGPLVELGPLSIGLYAVSSRTEHIAPTVVLASLSISLPDATTSSSTILPSLVLGPLVIPPQSVFCSVTIIVPEILFSSTGISGAVASTMAVAVNPDIPMGSVWYTPPPVTVGSISLNPSTFAGNQFCRPIADSSNSGWLNELGLSTNLYESINETTPSDTDYITTPISVLESHTITENLQVIEDPEVHVLHKMRFRYKTVGSVENGFYVQLSQVGVGTIATWSIASANDMYETVEVELTEEEAAAITDYSALQVSFYNGTQP